MVAVIKRKKKHSIRDLIVAIDRFVYLLEGQKEEEAIKDLLAAQSVIKANASDTKPFKEALQLVLDSYEDLHELSAYTDLPKDKEASEWSEAEELYLASIEVLNLVRRLHSSS